MPEQKQFWVCSFCRRKKSARRSYIEKHETNCFKNENRTPFTGELTFIARTGEVVNYGYNESIGGPWREWQDHDEMPQWWPGSSGMIYDGKKWRKVPGYRELGPKNGHGCAGGGPPDEKWPELDGVPLPQVRAADRLAIFELPEWEA